MSRQVMSPIKDQKFFRRTASETKTVNLGVTMMRGGIRF